MQSQFVKKNIYIWLTLILLSLLSSCATINKAPFPDKDIIRVAAVGDSITYGKHIIDREQNAYPAQLGKKLGPLWAVRNYGVSGATLLKMGNKPYWETVQLTEAYDFQPDLVIIKLGTNDTKPLNWSFHDYFVADYVELIRSFQDLQSRPEVFICYPVPAYSGRFGISDLIIKEDIIPFIDSIAEITGVQVIDLYRALSNRADLFPDKIHPDGDGAELIALTIYQQIR